MITTATLLIQILFTVVSMLSMIYTCDSKKSMVIFTAVWTAGALFSVIVIRILT